MDIGSFSDLYHRAVSPKEILSPVITGHLMVEFLLRKVIQARNPAMMGRADNATHAQLIEMNRNAATLTGAQCDVLVAINRLRNKFAHQISYEPTLAELKVIYESASCCFDDLTDGIDQGLDAINSAKSVDDLDEWVILELFVQISYDLHEVYQSFGGDMELF